MKNLSIENITKACRGTFHGDESILSQEVSGVVIDSRKVQPGYLFVAIDGFPLYPGRIHRPGTARHCQALP